ncbi:hypothetical protein [Xanthomonas sp. GW]|uniref:hypothetical protein n=1 Tax=Xanthomonas sp. GW TaxID=2724121 RepID=UPI00163A3290|nr:hypothetical protein [Xanthomonas sp. GW]
MRESGCKNRYQASQRHVGRALKPGYAQDKDIVDAGNTFGVCEAMQPVDRCLGSRRHAVRHLAVDGGQPTQRSPGALPAQILSPAILDTLAILAEPVEVKAMGPASVIAGSRHTVVSTTWRRVLRIPIPAFDSTSAPGNNKGIPYSSRYSKSMAAPSQEFAAHRLG